MAARAEVSAASLYFVIAVHNRRAHTRNCLECLVRQSAPGARVIVVDDGSTDGTSAMISTEFPDVLRIAGGGALWWSGATNLGVERALLMGATHVVCLNDDTLPQPAFVERLLAAANRMPDTLIGAYAIDADSGHPIFGGERMNWITAAPLSLLPGRGKPKPQFVDVTHAPGRGLLVPAGVFSSIGFFDAKRLPQYAADYDFTHRARRAGFRIICDYSVVLSMYPAASGDAANRVRKSWRNYWRHLFDVKGGGNLMVFFTYAVRNCPPPLLPACLLAGTARRVFGYLFDWILDRVLSLTRWKDAGHQV